MATPNPNLAQSTAQLNKNTQALSANTQKLNQNRAQMELAARDTISFADSTGRGRITLENFGKTFDNATRKVLVWQVAIMSVYGVMRKVGEIVQDWKDLELTLARISITTGAVGSQLEGYFKQVADIAIEFGMPIKQTLTGMDLALRATASLGTGARRTAVAVQLLRDASALANITGMQYSQSIDILVGALRQTGLGLDQGVRLLDKWVAVAKNAAVSVSDLSQGFAIMADAAEAAGLSVDQMNGLIAALSEKVTLGPVEIGNAIRSLMSTLYNASSVTALQKYGVAVKNATGEARNFWDIMTQLSAIRVAGALDDSAWLEIARAAGGGARRYAQFLALLDSIPTAMRVANISTNAQGQAMDANAKIVGTLTNTWDKFTESQKKLFMNMGAQTGAIRDLTSAIAGLTTFINKLSEAGPGVWQLARAIAFLVATMGTLKIMTAAMGWMGISTKAGGFLGKFAGIPAAGVAGTAAEGKALTALAESMRKQSPLEKAAFARGIGTIAPSVASSAGMLGLAGLLPGFMRNKIYGSALGGAQFNPATNRWMGYGAKGNYGFVPTPSFGGAPFQPMTWGRVGRALTKPAGFGMGAAVAGLGAGAAAYGLTGEWQSSVGAAIGSAAGMAFGGPVGMVAGAAIGTLIGHTITDAFISDEDRLKSLFDKIAKDFNVELAGAVQKATTPEEARKLAQQAAPEFTGNRLAESAPFWKRLLMGGVALGGPVSPANQYSFNAPWAKRPGEREWDTGLGGLNALNKALADGVITIDEYRKAKQKDYIAWNELSDAAKAYMTIVDVASSSDNEARIAAEAKLKVMKDNIDTQRKLQDIENRYSESQARIREIIKANNLEQWESTNVQKLLASQMRMTDEEFEKQLTVLLGSKYGYAAHLEAVERLGPALKEMGITVASIPEQKWLLIQRWDTNLATKIVETTTQLTDLINNIDRFKNVRISEILKIPGVQGTINDIEAVRQSIIKLSEQTGDEAIREQLQKALEDIDKYYQDLADKQVAAQKLGMISQAAPQFQRPGEVRLVDKETLENYRKELSQLPAFTKLAESLREFDTSVVTLVDPITGQTMRLEANTLALSMLQQAVNDNTAQEKRLEAEYNMPGWYQKPSRYWAMKTTQPTDFGPMQESLWQLWEEFIKQRSMQEGGTVPETGPYFLHKKEFVANEGNLQSTNNILNNSYQQLVLSSGYLSSINLGIAALRQEIAGLRAMFGENKTEGGQGEFSKVTRSNYFGVSSLGVSVRR